ncbi:acyl carrier protein [Aquabacterium sp.]|uniref:acyl carrier protein n=1 Tax=Aquabacterium sp. TaxID=1872578 RepID=UPI003D6CCB29
MNPISTTEALAMFSECFMEPAEQLSAEVSRESIPGWDSMGALMLIAELDERFQLELSAEESRTLQSIGDALAFLKRHGVLSD